MQLGGGGFLCRGRQGPGPPASISSCSGFSKNLASAAKLLVVAGEIRGPGSCRMLVIRGGREALVAGKGWAGPSGSSARIGCGSSGLGLGADFTVGQRLGIFLHSLGPGVAADSATGSWPVLQLTLCSAGPRPRVPPAPPALAEGLCIGPPVQGPGVFQPWLPAQCLREGRDLSWGAGSVQAGRAEHCPVLAYALATS